MTNGQFNRKMLCNEKWVISHYFTLVKDLGVEFETKFSFSVQFSKKHHEQELIC